MKWLIIIIFLILKSFNSAPINSNETRFSNPVKYWMHIIKNEFIEFVSEIIDNESSSKEIDALYDVIESLDEECFNFIVNFFFTDAGFIFDLTHKLFQEGGVILKSIGVEHDCIIGGTYLLFTSNNTIKSFRKDNKTSSKEAIFKESFNYREEICIFKECRNLYIKIADYFQEFQKNILYDVFDSNGINLTWINYEGFLNSSNNDIEMVKHRRQKIENERPYYKIVSIVFLILIIFFALVSIISWLIRENNREFESKFNNPLKYLNNKYKILSSFDFLKNISIINKKKEPLSDQTSLIELSTLKILILFFILMGENCYIFLRFIENKFSILPFFREIGFIFTKIGMNSYESYKVINGAIFGFKFISFYNKSNEFTIKKFLRFCTKPFPYILTFILIHFLFNYPIFIFARRAHDTDYKSFYLSEIMCNYYCQENPYNIFKFVSVLGKYSFMNGYDIKQFNGCTRPILFVFSEFVCFYIVMIISVINVFFKNKIVNIIYIILFFGNFVLLGMTNFISREVKDLVDEFTISRFFGLSESLAMPYLFFGLYYIGLNSYNNNSFINIII